MHNVLSAAERGCEEFVELWLRLLGSGINLSRKCPRRLILEDGEALLEAGEAAPEIRFGLDCVFGQLVPTHHHQDNVQLVQNDA